ncbi:MAG: cupin domain-containing protein [Acidobacteriota bacterium]
MQKPKLAWMAAAILVLTVAVCAQADTPAPAAAAPMSHIVVMPNLIVWGPPPPGLPPGSKAAILVGNPGVEGPYTLRALMPNGYKVPLHWHPTAENLTVISGILHIGMGETADPAKTVALGAGGFAVMDANMKHWVWAEGETVLQVHGNGPFSITYVNPADDPRQPAPPSK